MQGTPGFIAPEMLESNESTYSFEVDVYSFGMVLYELMSLRRPFEHADESFSVTKAVLSGDLPTIPDKLKSYYGEELCSLYTACTSISAHNRPSFSQVLQGLRSVSQRLARERERPGHTLSVVVFEGASEPKKRNRENPTSISRFVEMQAALTARNIAKISPRFAASMLEPKSPRTSGSMHDPSSPRGLALTTSPSHDQDDILQASSHRRLPGTPPRHIKNYVSPRDGMFPNAAKEHECEQLFAPGKKPNDESGSLSVGFQEALLAKDKHIWSSEDGSFVATVHSMIAATQDRDPLNQLEEIDTPDTTPLTTPAASDDDDEDDYYDDSGGGDSDVEGADEDVNDGDDCNGLYDAEVQTMKTPGCPR
eukprot:TRINITY_DN10246_c0_g1_i2.p1 TRINITY_DN10246_c0_g1~~TRINITY_DN10246_c0_g1_i2.p1  ORF type:complete len:366 (+),score=26.87 TRINITY_DN10246_c0_g1_i2:109-1206(+)